MTPDLPLVNSGAVPGRERRRLLHAGSAGEALPDWVLAIGDIEEIRLDISPEFQPDIVADMRQIDGLGPFDIIFCSHALEHLYPHEVIPCLRGFLRELRKGGHALIVVPDLEDVKATEDWLMDTNGGPISGLDMIYGKASLIESHPYMAHHCGFTQITLGKAMAEAGFNPVVMQRLSHYNLLGGGIKP